MIITSTESVKCPILNQSFSSNSAHSSPDLEVVLGFNNKMNPVAIMCDDYDSVTKRCRLKDCSCTYSNWQRL